MAQRTLQDAFWTFCHHKWGFEGVELTEENVPGKAKEAAGEYVNKFVTTK